MSKAFGFKFGVSALALPAVLSFAWYAASRPSTHKDEPAKLKEPESILIKKNITNVRKYEVKDYNDVYIINNPRDKSEHCIVSTESDADYSCYPDGQGAKPDAGHPINVEYYELPGRIPNLLIFDDPENTDLYCMRSVSGVQSICRPKKTVPVAPK